MESKYKIGIDAPPAQPKTELGQQLKGVKAGAGTGTQAKPPAEYPDAKQGKDGKWYVQRDGQFYMVK